MDGGLIIELFSFDWSGTCSDDRKPAYKANMRLLTDYKIPNMPFEEWLAKTKATPEEFIVSCGVRENPDDIRKQYRKYFAEEVARGNVPVTYPDVHKVFRYLKAKGKKLAVISTHPEENVIKEADEYGISQYLDLIQGNWNDKGAGIFGACLHLGTSPDCTLYTGDSVSDIQKSKSVGVHAAAVCTGYHTAQMLAAENPRFLIRALSELKALFESGEIR